MPGYDPGYDKGLPETRGRVSDMGIAQPEIMVASVEELFTDAIGQRWSPATILVTWPGADGLPTPSVEVKVIALARAEMTLDELNALHLQAAHDVLNAALLGIEQMRETSRPEPTLWPPRPATGGQQP